MGWRLFLRMGEAVPGADKDLKSLLILMGDRVRDDLTIIAHIILVEIRCGAGNHRFHVLANNEIEKLKTQNYFVNFTPSRLEIQNE